METRRQEAERKSQTMEKALFGAILEARTQYDGWRRPIYTLIYVLRAYIRTVISLIREDARRKR